MEAFTIRPVRTGDGPGIAAIRRMPGVRENILGFPAERDEMAEAKAAAAGKDKLPGGWRLFAAASTLTRI